MTEAKEGVEGAHDGPVCELLQLEAAFLRYALEGAGAKEHCTLKVTGSNLLDGALIFFKGLLNGAGNFLDEGNVLVNVIYICYHGTCEQHGGIAAGHGQGKVVGFRREEDAKDVLTLHLGQFSVLVAGDEDVGHLTGAAFHSPQGTYAFRAVAGTGETHKKDLAGLIEIHLGICDYVGGGNGTCSFEAGGIEGRLQGVSDIGRCSGTGKDNLITIIEIFILEVFDFLLMGTDGIQGLEPDFGLLEDFFVSVIIVVHFLKISTQK